MLYIGEQREGEEKRESRKDNRNQGNENNGYIFDVGKSKRPLLFLPSSGIRFIAKREKFHSSFSSLSLLLLSELTECRFIH